MLSVNPELDTLIRPFIGSKEFIRGESRYCLWIDDKKDPLIVHPTIASRLKGVTNMRAASTKASTVKLALLPHRFDEIRQRGELSTIIIPSHSSEAREHLPVGYLPTGTIVSNSAFFIEEQSLTALSIIASRLHLSWIATVCGKIKTDYRYSNTLGWNTFREGKHYTQPNF